MAKVSIRQVVERYWQAMNANDWQAASELLHDDFTLDYPQSGERFRGRASFIAVNADYPAAGPWRFDVRCIVASEQQAASDVIVTAPSITAQVISFFAFQESKIAHITDYWPDAFEAAAWRASLAEPIPPEPDGAGE